MINAIDRFFASLFVPLAILLCRITRLNQAQLHDYLWMFFNWIIFATAVSSPGASKVWIGVLGFFALFWTVRTAMGWVSTTAGGQGWRLLIVGLDLYHWGIHFFYSAGVLGPLWAKQASWDISCIDGLLLCTALYAMTIKTLPPREEKEPKRKLAPVRINQKR